MGGGASGSLKRGINNLITVATQGKLGESGGGAQRQELERRA